MKVARQLWRAISVGAVLVAASAAAAQTPDVPKPRIVLQSATNGAEVAAWVPGDRYLVTGLGAARRLTIWDTASGVVVDTIILPAGDGEKGSDYVRLTGIDVAADGTTALVHAIGLDFNKADGARSVEYRVNLLTRAAEAVPPRPLPAGTKGASALMQNIAALEVLVEDGTGMTAAAAEKLLPVLPRSHDGRLALRRAKQGMQILDGSRVVRTLAAKAVLSVGDAALAADGQRLALISESEADSDEGNTTVSWFDITTAAPLASVVLSGDYGELRWLDAGHVAVSYETDGDERDASKSDNEGPPDPVLILDAATGRTTQTVPPKCFVRSLPDGTLIGAGLAHCRAKVGNDRRLQSYDPARGNWQPLPVGLPATLLIDNLSVSPNGERIVAIVRAEGDVPGLVVIDRKNGVVVDSLTFPAQGSILNAQFAPDGNTIMLAANGGLQSWKPGDAASHPMGIVSIVPQMMVLTDRMLLVSSAGDESIVRVDLATGKRLPPLDFSNALAGGFVPGKSLFWAASYVGGLRIWDTRTWTELLTTYHFDGGKFVAVTPQGIYDTNLGPDAQEFRWIVPDAPFQSLAPQTFMRDYFEPRLTQRLLDCTAAANCAQVLPARPPISALNRVLPTVKIVSVTPSAPGYVTVMVEAREGNDPDAANGRTRSGLYNVRLFRNNRFAAHRPMEVNEVLHQSLAAWRETNGWSSGADANGIWRFPFEVPLPTAAGTEVSEFSAYAFNEDRVKSDTARYSYRRPPVPARQPRAYVITIGIDAYREPRLGLRFAAADAKLLGDRLAAIPGYEVRRAMLTGEVIDGKPRAVTRDTIRAVFATLIGLGDVADVKAALSAFDVTGLAQVTPDDIVIITYSGHGYANAEGDFFIVPSDAKWTPNTKPDESALISAADLTMFLRDVRGSEIAFIIDACHSAASVTAASFKPGPMGDAGLGQLAYDKGMRILAATQADDVALESATIRQGLMTYALAGEGITPGGGQADLDGNGRITLDEWLRYAVKRTPALSNDVRVGRIANPGSAGASGSRDFDLLDAAPAAPLKLQEPSLFDFTGAASPVVLRQVRR